MGDDSVVDVVAFLFRFFLRGGNHGYGETLSYNGLRQMGSIIFQ